MAVYIALLRGVNVGGRTIKMPDLKKMFEALELNNVQTYIQSGNVLFESDQEEDILVKTIETGIAATFGFTANVILRTSIELENVLENCPYSEEDRSSVYSPDYETFYITFFQTTPAPDRLAKLDSCKITGDDYILTGRDAYLLLRQSIRTSKLAGLMQKLDVPVTIRNFNTVTKLVSLAKDIHS